MARLLSGLRALVAVLILATGLGSALAQETDAPWQATITGQIEAFRAHDAPGAFGYASAPFHERFGSRGGILPRHRRHGLRADHGVALAQLRDIREGPGWLGGAAGGTDRQ